VTAIPTARADTVDSSELGFTLVTEQVIGPVTVEVENNWPEHTYAGAPEEQRIADAVAKLQVAKEAGVDTLIDRTLPGTGRSIPRLLPIAQQSPVNIIVATGWYTWNDLPFYFEFRDAFPAAAEAGQPTLEDLMVRDLEEGIAGTGVRAGIIKVVTDRYGITDGVRYAIGAGARAHRRTGVPITTHTGMNLGITTALLQQAVLEEEGVDLSRVNFGHVDFTPPDAPIDDFLTVLDRGSFISFDTIALAPMFPPEYREKRIERVMTLLERGYADQIMLSHDNSAYVDVVPETAITAAFPPFTEISRDFLPTLLERGVSQEHIDKMMIHNPRRLLESVALGGY
jgi:phosphotriesterase-related protein